MNFLRGLIKVKKELIITIIVLSLFGLNANSQAAIGHNRIDILNRYANYGIQSSVRKDGLNQALFQTENMLVIYYFNEDDICKETVISPLNFYSQKAYFEKFDKQYTRVDATNWTFTVNGILHYVHYEKVAEYGMFWFHL